MNAIPMHDKLAEQGPQAATRSAVPTLSRRRLLLWLGNLGLLAVLWELVQAGLGYLTPPVTQPQPGPVQVGEIPLGLDKFALNSLTFVPQARAWLGRDDGGFYAISAICPHLGCTLQQAATGFQCPCHGSRFNQRGALLNGPAATPMSYLAVRLQDNQLIIDVTQTVSPETRLAAPL